jgi:hypothetical protein
MTILATSYPGGIGAILFAMAWLIVSAASCALLAASLVWAVCKQSLAAADYLLCISFAASCIALACLVFSSGFLAWDAYSQSHDWKHFKAEIFEERWMFGGNLALIGLLWFFRTLSRDVPAKR